MGPSISPKKHLGQHYLHNQAVIQKICQSFSHCAEGIVEVGPGPGVLTKILASLPLPLTVVEKDQRFYPLLREFLAEEQITMADALKIDWSQYHRERNQTSQKIWLVSNLPYNVGVPLFIDFLQCPTFHYLTLMFQKEVGEKFLTHQKDMSSLQALGNNYFSVTSLCPVPRGSFTPPPEVESVVITFERRDNPKVSLEDFFSYQHFLRILFQQKRKQIKNVLKNLCPLENLLPALEAQKIIVSERAENLNLESVQNLFFELKNYFHGQVATPPSKRKKRSE